ncbi:MAG: DNA-directed RNA polymerase subunit alpha [Gemmatimonadota bacterium]
MSVALDLTRLVLPETVAEQRRSEDGRRAQFLLQPLERGFGHTIGNSVRRILLSSLPGSAIWAVRIDGVQHEHQTIEAVVEDVHQVIQNLKKIVLVLDPGVNEARLELRVHKPGPVRASQIIEHPSVKVVNGDQLIFTLQEGLPENRPLTVDLWANRGRGFVMAERHEVPPDAPVDMIRIDAIYNPVISANFTVQETRVGQRTDFDRLAIDVETNGAMDPDEALREAAEIARLHLGYLSGIDGPLAAMAADDRAPKVPERVAIDEETRVILEQPLEEFEQISARSRNTLEKQNLHSLVEIASKTRDEMLGMSNFGEKSLEEVAEVLAAHGLHFGMTFSRDEDGKLYVSEGAAENGAAGNPGPDDEA